MVIDNSTTKDRSTESKDSGIQTEQSYVVDKIIECFQNCRIEDKEYKTPKERDDNYFAILDSGATANIFAEEMKEMFSNIYAHKNYVICANDQAMRGDWAADEGLLKSVLFHNTSKNLISVSKIVEEGCNVNFGLNSFIQIKETKIDLESYKGLYYLTKEKTRKMMEYHTAFAGVARTKTRTPAIVRQIPAWLREDLIKKGKLKMKQPSTHEEAPERISEEEYDTYPGQQNLEEEELQKDDPASQEMELEEETRRGPPTSSESDHLLKQGRVITKEAQTQTRRHYHKMRSNNNSGEMDPQVKRIMNAQRGDILFDQHIIMGHAPFLNMKRKAKTMPQGPEKEAIETGKTIICPVCTIGRLRALDRGPVAMNRASKPFEKIGLDWVAKHKFAEDLGEGEGIAKGYFLAVDYFTDFTMIYPSMSKEDAPAAIDHFIQEILKLGRKVEEIRTDAGSEFVNKKFVEVINPYAIAHTTATAGQQWQNGKAESRVRTVLEMARCLLLDANLSQELWISASRHAVCILNNLISLNKKESPRKMLGLEELDLEALPRFGALGIARVTNITSNIQPRGEPCIFLTVLDEKEDRFLVMLKGSGRVVKRENVVFFEDIEDEDTQVFETIVEAHLAANDQNQPSSIKVALESSEKEEWLKAINKEVDNLKAHKTLEKVEGFVQGKILRSFMILRKVVKNDGSIKYKARLVVLGNMQVIDDDESVYAPTCPLSVNLLLDNIAVNYGYKIVIMDIEAAFLKGRNTKEEYTSVSKELALLLGDDERTVFRIAGNLYGTRQAPVIWYETFVRTIESLGFKQSKSCLTLFTRKRFGRKDSIIITLYVDDMKVLYKDDAVLDEFIREINEIYDNTSVDKKFKKFLGISYNINKNFIALDHESYIIDNIKGLCDYNEDVVHKPPKLKPVEDEKPDDIKECLRLAGIIRFIADRARIDIMFHINEIMSGLYQKPLEALKSLARYIVATKSRKIVFRKSEEFNLIGYCDASHIRNADAKSRLAVAIFVNEESAPFYTISTKTSENFTTISISSCEAELKAIYEATIAIEYFSSVLDSLGIKLTKTPVIYSDNLSAITIINNGEGNSKIRHINTRILYIHRQVKNGILKVKKVDTKNNKVDFLTKYFPSSSFEEAADKFTGSFRDSELQKPEVC